MPIKRLCILSSLIVAALLAGLVPGVVQTALAQVDESSAQQDQGISVNQTGYYPGAPKHGVVVSDSQTPLDWRLADSQGDLLLEGQTIPFGDDAASGESLHQIDFSAFAMPGTGYLLQVGEASSVPFEVSSDLYSDLKNEALAYFYLNRSGMPIEEQYTADPLLARPAGHLSDGQITCYTGPDASGKEWEGCDYTLDAAGGWYDAGDHGKYVVNGGISVWTLLNLYERFPEIFPDGSLSLPENQNGVPDLLDEARWELEFLMSMQVPEGEKLAGMVHHKLHGKRWDPMLYAPPESSRTTGPDGGRSLFPPSTAATLNLAATAAQCARIWETIDPDFSTRCLAAAETAWQAANAYPTIAAVVFDAGGGPYGDANFADEFYWAASELYLTTGEESYSDRLLSSKHFADTKGLYWANTAALGTISLAMVPNELPTDQIEQLRQSVVSSADGFIRILESQGYLIPIAPGSYVWGSNSDVLNRMMMMGLAYDFTQDQVYLNNMTESMDYLLGRNPLNKSYVSGYGENPMENPHHRFWGNQPSRGFPPAPAGAVAGGPNGKPADPATAAAGLTGKPPAKSYVDAYGSYSTNEVAINWNAPLAWSAAYLDQVGSQVYAEPEVESQPVSIPTQTSAEGDSQGEPPWLWIVLAFLRLAANAW